MTRTIARAAAAAVAATILAAACGGGSGGSGTTTPPPAAPPPAATGSCAIPYEPGAQTTGEPRPPKAESTGDRTTRRGRVYEELWKHQAAAGRPRPASGPIAPASTAQDVGQIAVIRDEGDLLLPANLFDLRSTAILFAPNGSGGYDVRPSPRPFQSSVGDKIALDDDASARLAIPFTLPFYAGRYTELFLNSDGNVTFGVEDHASTDRNVARFLTGPPRIAPIFDDLDPSASGGVYRRTENDALLLTWCNVPEFSSAANRVNVQLRLGSDGSIEFVYGAVVSPSTAVVGVSPGETGIFLASDLSTAATAALSGGGGAIGERFSNTTELDFVALSRAFYRTHGDDYDQIVLFTNAATTKAGTFAFEFSVANEVEGIGLQIFDASRDFGSGGRLRSVVDMDRLARYPDDPRQRFLGENNTLSILGQECGHRWLAYLEFRDGAANSTELLGRDEAHWSFFFNSDASDMEGNQIDDLGNGAFRTVGAVSRYSALDQYVMGLRAASDVPPMFLVTRVTSGGAPEDAPKIGVDIRGTRKDLRIADIVAAMGPRRPDASSAPKTFRQAWMYLVSKTPETSDELGKIERLRSAWETYFGDATGGRGTMNAKLR